MPKHLPIAERFWSRVQRAGDNECWIWTGLQSARLVVGEQPYGVIKGGPDLENRKTLYAHRLSFFLHHHRWPLPGMVVLHTRDNRLCVNPAHLREGTQADNIHDAQTKRRLAYGDRNAMARPETRAKLQGEKNPSAKLTQDQVNVIRQAWAEGTRISHLAREFGVSVGLLSRIVRGLAWPTSKK